MNKRAKNTGLKSQIKVFNKLALDVGGDLVNLAIKNGEATQRVFSKVLKGGVTLMGMQHDMTLSAAEKAMKLFKKSKANLVGQSTEYYNTAKKATREGISTLKDKVEDAKEVINEKVEEVKIVVTDKVEDTKVGAAKAVKQVTKKASNLVDDLDAELEESLEEVDKVVKKVTAKAKRTKKAVRKTTKKQVAK